MSELDNESIRSASLATAQSPNSASASHSSCFQPSSGSPTQAEPRVAAYMDEAALALEEAREAARLAAISAAKAPTTDEITALFTDAASDVRDARLIVASTRFPSDTSQNSSIIPLPYKATRRVTFGVIQQAQDVDLPLDLSLKDANTGLVTPISCQISYDPGKDHCVFKNHTNACLHFRDFSEARVRALPASIRGGKSRFIPPGKWRISIDGDSKGSGEYPLAEFWLRGRQFDVTIQTARRKRGIGHDAEENVNKRRKQKSHLTGTTSIQPINKTTKEPRPAAIATKRTKRHYPSPSLSIQKTSDKATVPLLDLKDGDGAFIWALEASTDNPQSLSGAKGPAGYQVWRVEPKGATPSANVFACKHSAVSGPVVAKVLQYNRNSPDEIEASLSLWKTEKATLEKLKHRNVVALKAFDGRMLSLYLELLPASLDRIELVEFSQSDIFRILLDISSALVYLKTIPVIHNDIKPSNITYSSQRGAVLIDFGLATSTNEYKAGGTCKYVPPERLINSRGSPGDVWALGITMLYLLGKIQYPETNGSNWDIHELSNKEYYNRMVAWLKRVYEARATLSPVNAGTVLSKLEFIVFKMLERNSQLRFDAENIISALGSSTAF